MTLIFAILTLSFSQLLHQSDLKHLDEWHGREVEIRGFVYEDGHKRLILAQEPDLKTCCIGTKKISEQIVLLGSLPVKNVGRAVTVRGIFDVSPRWDEEGKLSQLFILDQARTVEPKLPWEMYALGGFGAIGAGYYAKRRRFS